MKGRTRSGQDTLQDVFLLSSGKKWLSLFGAKEKKNV